MYNSKSITFDCKIKADGVAGSFTAIGNAFGNIDHAGDKTMKGAFTKCIQSYNSSGTMPMLLSQHQHQAHPIGVITSMKETETGLEFEGQLCLETQLGKETHALMKMGAMNGWSIGYATIKEILVNGVNELHELDVREISAVTFPCNTDSVTTSVKSTSLIQSVKSAVENGEEITPRMIQKSLQEAGLSKRQAEAAVNAIKATDVAVADEMKTSLEVSKSKPETVPETNDDCKGVEETPEVKEEEPTQEVSISDGLKSEDIASWFNVPVLEEVKEEKAIVEEVKETTETIDFADWFK